MSASQTLDRVALPAVELEAVLAGVPGAGDEALGAGHLAGDEVVVGDVGEAGGGQRLEQRLGLGALQRQQPDLAGDVLEADVDAALLLDDVLPGLGRVRGVDHDHELVVEPVDGAVVDEGALRREDRGVLHPAGLERADVVAGDPVHEGVPVGPGDLELAHVGDVEHPGAGAHRVVLGQDAGGILHRHLPAGEGDHLGAQASVRIEQRGASERRCRCHVSLRA